MKKKECANSSKAVGREIVLLFSKHMLLNAVHSPQPHFFSQPREGTTTGGIEKVFEGSSSGGGSQQLWERDREESGNMCKQWGIEHIVLACKASCMCEGEIARQFKNIYCCFYHSTHFRPYTRISNCTHNQIGFNRLRLADTNFLLDNSLW